MLTRNDLQKLAQLRLEDAFLLHQHNRPSSAYYLAGYSLELAIKACIAKLFQADVIPDKGLVNAAYTHKFESLLSTAGLFPAFRDAMLQDPQMAAHWGVVSQWSEASRYEFWDPMASAAILMAIADEEHGVYQWVKQHW